jgi:hypothetical protein
LRQAARNIRARRKCGYDALAGGDRVGSEQAWTLQVGSTEDLKDLGVSLLGHRRRLLEAIAALRNEGNPEPVAKPRVVTVTATAERRQLEAWAAGIRSPQINVDAEG